MYKILQFLIAVFIKHRQILTIDNILVNLVKPLISFKKNSKPPTLT